MLDEIDERNKELEAAETIIEQQQNEIDQLEKQIAELRQENEALTAHKENKTDQGICTTEPPPDPTAPKELLIPLTKLIEPMGQEIRNLQLTSTETIRKLNKRLELVEAATPTQTQEQAPKNKLSNPQAPTLETGPGPQPSERSSPPLREFPSLTTRNNPTPVTYAQASRLDKPEGGPNSNNSITTIKDLHRLIPQREKTAHKTRNWSILRNPSKDEPMSIMKKVLNSKSECIKINSVSYTSNKNILIRTENSADLKK